ncbi:hypothetical protein JY651_49230 [Pyxidicoccus parkwayensis]|uniref:Lipoprotein n=1 Tax=Pyxidicoccus parkwayensis TaxID=2813578 RepID=A0ABX7NX07_9BACT|nr:hypothetical protein [Pyxidicoccus parkwaysis]QSQ22993.1 hypothetical protein JY651_49230 [Pyxidicoccus parkwaysis]
MRAETRLLRGVGLWLAAAFFATGCASLPSPSGHGVTLSYTPGLSPAQGLRAATASLPEDSAGMDGEVPLYRRLPTQTHGAGWGETAPLRAPQAAAAACGDVPSGWPHLDSEDAVLAPFLGCPSPAAFVALQRTVDMPRLVESLSDWNAVRLGALGPLDADAARVLLRKRAAFLATAAEKYGPAQAEVLTLFVLHTAHDDEVRELVRLLAEDKLLKRTLGPMEVAREELRQRGLALTDFPERDFRASDLARGLGRAADDVAASIPLVGGSRSVDVSYLPQQLPPPYREAYQAVQKAQYLGAFAPGNVALGAFDHLTFGVPVGFYHLASGTVRGGVSLAEGEYEEATRQLTPAALLVGLYAGGTGARAFREAPLSRQEGARLQAVVPRVEALKAVLERLEAQLGEGAVGELAQYLRQSREAALLVAEWGETGARTLHEARGNTGRAQAMLSEALRERPRSTSTGSGAGKGGGTPSALPPESAGLAPEVAEARFKQVEAEHPGPRLPMDVVALKKHRQALLKIAAPGVTAHPFWSDYVSYLETRTAEIKQGTAAKGPLKWAGYQEMRGEFARGLAFERLMVSILEKDAALPRAQRHWLKDFNQPRVVTHVGVVKADLRFVDALVIEGRHPAGQSPRVETFSFKSRDLRFLNGKELTAQMVADATTALRYYGETVNIRRPGLEQTVQVQRVRLVYEGNQLKPRTVETLEEALEAVKEDVDGVEVLVQ